jgi:cytochrome c2
MRNRILLALTLAAGCAAVPAFAQDADLAAQGEKVWKRCAACHMIGEGAENRVGPELNKVIGRTAGSLEDYAYSDAMKKAGAEGLVWDNDKLFAYLENPKKMVPGTKMAFAGLKKEEDRHAVVAYIDTHGGE